MEDDFNLLPGQMDLIPDLAIDMPEVPPASKEKTPAETRKAKAKLAGGTVKVPITDVLVWANAVQSSEHIDPADLDRELEIFEVSGQRVPVIGRETSAGVEILTHTYMVGVVRAFNERHPDMPAMLDVEIRDIDDAIAYRLVARTIETGPAISSYDRGLFYQRAVEQFGSEKAAARECAIDKGTVSRNLDVVRAVELAGHKIAIHREVSQRDAAWLMGAAGRAEDRSDAPDTDAAEKVMAVLDASDILPAKALFGAMKKALKADKPKRGQSDLLHQGHAIGTIRRKKEGGPIRIDLTDAGDIELDTLIEVIRAALVTARSQQTV